MRSPPPTAHADREGTGRLNRPRPPASLIRRHRTLIQAVRLASARRWPRPKMSLALKPRQSRAVTQARPGGRCRDAVAFGGYAGWLVAGRWVTSPRWAGGCGPLPRLACPRFPRCLAGAPVREGRAAPWPAPGPARPAQSVALLELEVKRE